MTAENIQEQVNTEEVVDVVEVAEQQEEQQYSSQITIFGNTDAYSWVGGDNGELAVEFCTFNTKIGEATYRTTIGIKEDGTPIAVISYNEDITTDVVNFIVNHVMLITCQCSTKNDELFYNRTEEGAMNSEGFNPLTPVLEMITVLHSWANISRFQSGNENQEA